MKKLFIFAIAALAMMTGCKQKTSDEQSDATENQESVVYMTKEITPESLVKIYEALGVEATGRVAVKISTGEGGNTHYLQPSLISQLVSKVNGTIVECNTAYPGTRNTTEAHWQTIREHGFLDIAKVDIMDEEGTMQIPVADTTHIKYDIVGSHLANYDFFISLSHFKGHGMGGYGGALKNQSIGVASSSGKAYIHSAGYTDDVNECWNHIEDQDGFLESMAAAAQAVHNHFGEGKIVYINVVNNLSVDCDCDGTPEAPVLKDMGILASTDPVALDQACIDLVYNHRDTVGDDSAPLRARIERQNGIHTIEHAAKIGLGKREYKMVKID